MEIRSADNTPRCMYKYEEEEEGFSHVRIRNANAISEIVSNEARLRRWESS